MSIRPSLFILILFNIQSSLIAQTDSISVNDYVRLQVDSIMREIANDVCLCIDQKIERSKKKIKLKKIEKRCFERQLGIRGDIYHRYSPYMSGEEISLALNFAMEFTCPKYNHLRKKKSLVEIEGKTNPNSQVIIGKVTNSLYSDFFYLEITNDQGEKEKLAFLNYFEGAQELIDSLPIMKDRRIKLSFVEDWVFIKNKGKFEKKKIVTDFLWD